MKTCSKRSHTFRLRVRATKRYKVVALYTGCFVAVPSLTEPVVSKSVSEASIVEPVGHDVTPSSPSSPSSPSPPVSPAIEACPDEPLFSDVGGSITIKSDAVSFSSLSDLSSCVDAKTEPVAPPGGDAVKRSLNALSNFSRGLGTSYSRITGRGRPAGGATYGEEGEEWDILSVRSEAFSDDDDTDSLLRLADVTELPAFDVSAWPGVGEVNEGSEVNSVGTGSTTDNRMAGMVELHPTLAHFIYFYFIFYLACKIQLPNCLRLINYEKM